MLKCVAVCCSVLQCVAVYSSVSVCCNVLQGVAVRYSVLQCVAVRRRNILYIHMYVCIFICTYLRTYINTHTCTHIHINFSGFGCFGTGFGERIDIYIFICYIYAYIYIYIHTHPHDFAASARDLAGKLIIQWAAGKFQEKLVCPRGVKRGRGWGQGERGKGGG